MKDGAWQEDAKPRDIHGATGGIRTPDPRLRRPLLCPTELLTHLTNNISILTYVKKVNYFNKIL